MTQSSSNTIQKVNILENKEWSEKLQRGNLVSCRINGLLTSYLSPSKQDFNAFRAFLSTNRFHLSLWTGVWSSGGLGRSFFYSFSPNREPVHRLIPRLRRSANRALDGIKVIQLQFSGGPQKPPGLNRVWGVFICVEEEQYRGQNHTYGSYFIKYHSKTPAAIE